MVSRAWCFGFGSGWGRQTCFSLAVWRSKRWSGLQPIGNTPYRLRGLGTIWVWDHAMTIGVQGDFLIFQLQHSNIHSHIKLDFDLLRSVQFPCAKNSLCAPASHDTILANKRNSTPDHSLLRPRNKTTWTSVDDPTFNSTCYKLTPPTSSGRSATSRHHLPDLCTVPRTHIRDCQQTKKSEKSIKKPRGGIISVARKHDAVDMYLATVDNINVSSRMICPVSIVRAHTSLM